jgi:hypothetical protein
VESCIVKRCSRVWDVSEILQVPSSAFDGLRVCRRTSPRLECVAGGTHPAFRTGSVFAPCEPAFRIHNGRTGGGAPPFADKFRPNPYDTNGGFTGRALRRHRQWWQSCVYKHGRGSVNPRLQTRGVNKRGPPHETSKALACRFGAKRKSVLSRYYSRSLRAHTDTFAKEDTCIARTVT